MANECFCPQILMNVKTDRSVDRTVNVSTYPAPTRATATLGLNCPPINIVKVCSQKSTINKQKLNKIRHEKKNTFIIILL